MKLWEDVMREAIEVHGEPKRPAVKALRFPNGMIAAFDDRGEQIPQVQRASALELGDDGLDAYLKEATKRGWVSKDIQWG